MDSKYALNAAIDLTPLKHLEGVRQKMDSSGKAHVHSISEFLHIQNCFSTSLILAE